MSESTAASSNAVSDHHKRFEPFAGKFKATVKMWMGPGDPHLATGTMVNSLVLGGTFLQQSYRGDDDQGAFSGFAGEGFWGYNTTSKKYEGFWIDSASTMMQLETGDVDTSGKVWTMIGEMISPQTQQPIKKRSIITLVDADHHTMETYFTGPDGKENKVMAIAYQRAT